MLVVLHGYAMEPMDLAPLVDAMGLPATIYLPRGIHPAEPRGRSWWPVDAALREQQMAAGDRDLFDEYPPGREALRRQFNEFIAQTTAIHGEVPLILVGFSQGGMLATDLVLMGGLRPVLLALLSSSRIAHAQWQERREVIRGMPVLVSHGRNDADLPLATGERLRDFFREGGAQVSWLPFDGGHGIPLPVWRELRRLASRHLVRKGRANTA